MDAKEASIAGTWTFSVEHIGVKLLLEQKKAAVTGTLAGTLKAHFDEFDDAHEVVRVRNQEIPWTAKRGLHVVHFPR